MNLFAFLRFAKNIKKFGLERFEPFYAVKTLKNIEISQIRLIFGNPYDKIYNIILFKSTLNSGGL